MTEEKKVFNYDECVICFEPLKTANTLIFPCFHRCCHVTCFLKSISSMHSAECPICRLNLIEREEAECLVPALQRPRSFPTMLLVNMLNSFYEVNDFHVSSDGGGIVIEGSIESPLSPYLSSSKKTKKYSMSRN